MMILKETRPGRRLYFLVAVCLFFAVSTTVAAFADVTIDNGGPGTSYTGKWRVSGGADPYGTNSLWGSGNSTYTWHAGLQSGTYDVYMWWTSFSDRSADAPVTITYGSGSQTVQVNQLQYGGMWNYLGTFSFDAAQGGTVKLSATGSTAETVCADAVRFVYISGSGGNTAPVANNDTVSTTTNMPVSINVLANDTDEEDDIDPASVAITSNPSHGTALPQVDGTIQYTPSMDYAGPDSLEYTVRDAEGAESNPAVVTITINPLTDPGDVVIDNGNTGTTSTGTWRISGGVNPYGTNSLWGSGTSTYTWHADLQSGTYDVYMWWTSYSDRSTDAPVTIAGTSGSQTVQINQQQNGGKWNYLGSFSFDAAQGGTVKLSATGAAAETVCADAVKFVPAEVGNEPPAAAIDSVTPSPAYYGEDVTLSGHGIDNDGTVRAYEWISDIDGILSNDASFTTTSLSKGIHTIFFRVQDDKLAWSKEATALIAVEDCSVPIKIMPLGDSITDGIGEISPTDYRTGYRQPLYLSLANDNYYVDFVGSRSTGALSLPVFDIQHQGVPGITDDEVASLVYDWLVQSSPDIVLLHIGTNNLNINPWDVEDILNEIDRYESDYDRSVLVFLARIINRQTYSPDTTSFNNNVELMAEDRIAGGDKIIMVDQESALDYSVHMYDNLHPNSSGYEKMTNVWLNVLTGVLPLCYQSEPFIFTQPITEAAVNQPYTYTVGAVGSPASSYRLLTAPAGMTINGGTGKISWTPGPGQGGGAAVSVEASSSAGSDVQNFSINVSEGVVIDNGDAETSFTGTWRVSAGINPYGTNSFWGSGNSTYTWHTYLQSGTYDVYMWWTSYSDRSTDAPVTITGASGSQTVQINQQQNGGTWNYLGTFSFDAAQGGTVKLSATGAPSETVCADAVKFVYSSPDVP